jgi:beta-lactam-binding protein with PASTA domain
MADDLNEVQPGDLITADLLNAIIRRLQGVSAGPGGTVDVPNLFGRTLSSAVILLQTPGSNLLVGVILDASGNVVASVDPNVQGSRVLSQTPPAGIKVSPATAINLVIAAASTTQPPLKPIITSLDKTTAQVNDILNIFGTGFDPNPINNQVKVGTIAATVNPVSTTTNLLITIPTGADAGAQPTTLTVTVGSQQATTSITIQPASGPPLATITSINGSTSNPTAITGGTVTMVGNNFGTTVSAVAVFFGANESSPSATPTAVTNTTLSVVVPTNLPGLTTSSPPITVRPFIRVAGKSGPPSPVPLQIAKLS